MSNHEDRQAVPANSITNKFNPTMQGLSISVAPPIIGKIVKPIFHLDVEKYIGQLDCYDMTEQEKNDLLYALWDIMCRFVELGFGLDSHDETRDKTSKTPSSKASDMLE